MDFKSIDVMIAQHTKTFERKVTCIRNFDLLQSSQRRIEHFDQKIVGQLVVLTQQEQKPFGQIWKEKTVLKMIVEGLGGGEGGNCRFFGNDFTNAPAICTFTGTLAAAVVVQIIFQDLFD